MCSMGDGMMQAFGGNYRKTFLTAAVGSMVTGGFLFFELEEELRKLFLNCSDFLDQQRHLGFGMFSSTVIH